MMDNDGMILDIAPLDQEPETDADEQGESAWDGKETTAIQLSPDELGELDRLNNLITLAHERQVKAESEIALTFHAFQGLRAEMAAVQKKVVENALGPESVEALTRPEAQLEVGVDRGTGSMTLRYVPLPDDENSPLPWPGKKN